MKKSRKDRRALRQANTMKAGARGAHEVGEKAGEEVGEKPAAEGTPLICCVHEGRPATTVLCQHLVVQGAQGLGFYAAASGDSRPGAWCGACSLVWQANDNQFNDKVKAALNPQARCIDCYDEIARVNALRPVATEL